MRKPDWPGFSGKARIDAISSGVSLRAVAFKSVLDDLRAILPAERHGVICAERVHDMDIVRNFPRLRQRGSEGVDRVKRKNND
jgi:hypothetical protein